MLREKIAVYSENRMKLTKTLCGNNAELFIVKVVHIVTMGYRTLKSTGTSPFYGSRLLLSTIGNGAENFGGGVMSCDAV